ncbi:MAG: DEAD/DEAH box helicase [Chitinispirillaceae bacterium]
MTFSKFDLDEQIISSLEDAGYSEPMPVQDQTLEHTLAGKDVLVQSQTGTGKTAAFLISVFALLRSGKLKHNRAMIIAPTRELAVQIEKEANLLGNGLDLGICSFYGGVGYGRQESYLSKGVEIMIGTPGRILDFKKSRKIDFSKIGMFVIDEADRLFDMGFLPDITEMLRSLPPCEERMTMLFSATLSREVRKIARTYMKSPVEIELAPERITVDGITQEIFHVSSSEKMNLLLGILKKEKPSNALIFTNMKGAARVVAQRLRHNGYPCEYLSGDLSQGKRSSVVEKVKSGDIRYLVATDVAARGIHIDDLELVVNYDIPEHCENYVHRIGRTARAGKSGKAISLACEDYVYGVKPIEQFTNMKIPVGNPDSELFVEDSSEGMTFRRDSRSSGSNRNSRGRPSSRGASSRRGPGSPRSRNPERGSGSGPRRPGGQKGPGRSSSRNPQNSQNRTKKGNESFNAKPRSQSKPKQQKPVSENRPVSSQKKASEKKMGWLKKTAMKLFGK